MKKLLLALVLCAVTSCRKSGGGADASACQQACTRVASLRLTGKFGQIKAKLHEMDEKVDAAEDFAKKREAEIASEAGVTVPRPGPKALQKLPAAQRAAMIRGYDMQDEQLKQEREAAIRRAHENVEKARREYEEAKAEAEATQKSDTAAEMQKCVDPCIKRDPAFAACLQRVQAVEDVDVCEHDAR